MGLTSGLMASSSISSLATGYTESMALKSEGSYKQKVADINASLSRLAGVQALEKGAYEVGRKETETRAAVGEERAVEGASGTDVGSGSNMLVQNATRLAGNLDEITIRHNAQREAWGYETQAEMDTFEGQMDKITAASEAHQSMMKAGLQAITTPLTIESNYLRWARYMGGGSGSGGVPFPDASAGANA